MIGAVLFPWLCNASFMNTELKYQYLLNLGLFTFSFKSVMISPALFLFINNRPDLTFDSGLLLMYAKKDFFVFVHLNISR